MKPLSGMFRHLHGLALHNTAHVLDALSFRQEVLPDPLVFELLPKKMKCGNSIPGVANHTPSCLNSSQPLWSRNICPSVAYGAAGLAGINNIPSTI